VRVGIGAGDLGEQTRCCQGGTAAEHEHELRPAA
jgi:hypothetical protein